MTLFRPEGREARSTETTLEKLLSLRGKASSSGVVVNQETAQRLGAVFAAVDLISRLIKSFPFHEYRLDTDGVRVRQSDPPLLVQPSLDVPLSGWVEQIVASLLFRGNTFGLVTSFSAEPGIGGVWPRQIEMLNPDCVTYTRVGRRGPFVWRVEGVEVDRWPAGPLWHVAGHLRAGSPVGLSPISYAAETIGLGLAAQRFGGQWFRDGAMPTGTLSSDKEIDETAAKWIKRQFLQALDGNREPVVLANGIKYDTVSVAAEESQFLESIGANVADVARFFGVPPEEIGGSSGNSMTYSNIESRGVSLLVRTIGPWTTVLEEALSALRPKPRVIRATVDSLLRTDTITRYKAHQMAIRDGWRSVNETRRLEDQPPIENGDQYLWPPGRMQLSMPELDEGADGASTEGGSNAP